MIQVQARIQNPEFKLKTHMLVEAQIALPPQTQLHIPNTALLMQGDHEFVYRLTPSSQAQWQQNGWYEAQKIEVKSGRIGPSRTEIRSGLEPGDLVVSQGVMRVDPKTPVKIKAMQDDAAQAQLLQTQSAPSAKAP
jgi:membrane fusion protein (multidrug efflux system)